MRRVAIATLARDGLRTSMVIVGLGVVWALVVVQTGLKRGFEGSARALIDRVGGDLWISAKGVRVVDDGEPLTAPQTGDACIARVRPVVVDYSQVRRPDRSLVTVQIVGVDGAPASIDVADVEKLGLPAHPIGKDVGLRTGRRIPIEALTRGARNFTQTPYLFVDTATAREVLGLGAGTATFWVVDARASECIPIAERSLVGEGRDVWRSEALARSTVTHWIGGSGIGTLLGVGSLMAAVVGAIVLLQTGLSTVRTHLRELATVRALGARRSELAAFVGWQVGVIATLAAAVALALASVLAKVLAAEGLSVVVDRWTWTVGAGIALASTGVTALVGARVLGRIELAKVLE